MRLFSIAAILLPALAASAARLTVSIPSSQLLQDPKSLPASTHAVLLGPSGVKYDVPLRRDNTFVFASLDPGSYLLTAHTRDYFFSPFRVDVEAAEAGTGQEIVQVWQTFRGNEWDNKGPRYAAGSGEVTVEINPSGKKEFYQSRGGFNITGILKSPMILMALVSVAMIFGMPYLMENSKSTRYLGCGIDGWGLVMFHIANLVTTVDEETKKEFDEMSAKSPISGNSGAASSIQNFDLAGFLAGSSGGAGGGTKK